MRKYLFIGLGGALAAICKFLTEGVHLYHYKGTIPLNTMIFNIAGCFLLAFVLTVLFEVWKFSIDIRLGLVTGFLGSCTAFQALCREIAQLLVNGDYFSAISYMTFSTMFGLAAVYCGIAAARKVMAGIAEREDTEALEETSSVKMEIDSKVS